MSDQASIPDNFEIITDVVSVDADNFTNDDDDGEPVRCNCRPNGGQTICVDEHCYNFATQIECTNCYKGCRNNRILKRRYSKLYTKDTAGKGHGLFAGEDLVAGQFVMEYVGELVSSKELNHRLQRLREISLKNGEITKHLYVMQLKPGVFLDARRKGSISRFINHSCEPNCLIEIWTVGKHLRVGIFTMKDIPVDGELNFDYQWSPSKGRPPTKCLCGTPSCRGTIEVLPSNFDDTFSAASIHLVRRGMWRPYAELPSEIIDDPKLLVGGRVKVWWDGNQEFFEADVVEFNESTRKHRCRYDIDGTIQDEHLLRNPSLDNQRGPGYEIDWNWLDESQEEFIIKKKDRVDDIDFDELELLDLMPVSHVQNNKRQNRSQTSESFVSYSLHGSGPTKLFSNGTAADPNKAAHTHTTCRVHFDAAQWTVDTVIGSANTQEGVDRIQPFNTSINKALCWTTFLGQIERFYKCKAYISTTPGTNSDEINDIKDINIVGELANVNRAIEGIDNAKTGVIENLKRLSTAYTESLQMYQGVVMTKDWRRYPIATNTDMGFSEYDSLRELLFFNGRTRCVLSKEQLIFLRRSKAALATVNKSNTVSDSMRRSAMTNLRGMMSKLGAVTDISVHATIILLRYLSSGEFGLYPLSDDIVIKDMTAIIASSFLLASKASGRNHFKPKSIKRIIVCAYSQVFSRSEKEVEISIIEYYLRRTLDKERDILSALQYDIYIADVSSIVFANRAFSNTSESCHMVQQIVHQAYELLFSLLYIVPDLFLTFSVELLMYSSIIVVSNMKLHVASVDTVNSYPELVTLYKTLTCLFLETAAAEYSRLPLFYSFNKEFLGVAYQSILKLILLDPTVHQTIASETTWLKDSCDCFLYYSGSLSGLQDLLKRSIGFVAEYLNIQQTLTSVSGSSTINGSSEYLAPGGRALSRTSSAASGTSTASDISHDSLSELSKTTKGLKFEPIIRGYKFRHSFLQPHAIFVGSHTNTAMGQEIKHGLSTVATTADHTAIPLSRDLFHVLIPSADLLPVNAHHVDPCNELKAKKSSTSLLDSEAKNKIPIVFGLRSFPTAKQGQHESKKSQPFAPSPEGGTVVIGSGLGVSWTSIRELFILQHLHAHFPVSNNPGTESTHTTSPYFIVPIGMYDCSTDHGRHLQTQSGSDNLDESGNDQKKLELELAGSIKTINETWKLLERSNSGPEIELNRSKLLNELKLIQHDVNVNCAQKNRVTSTIPTGLSMLIKPVLLQLQSIFPLIQQPKESMPSESAPVASAFVRGLIHDAISAIDHLSTCGVYLKWLSLEHIYISSEGYLVIGELSGACVADRPHQIHVHTSSGDDTNPVSHRENPHHKSENDLRHKSSSSKGFASASGNREEHSSYSKKRKESSSGSSSSKHKEDNNSRDRDTHKNRGDSTSSSKKRERRYDNDQLQEAPQGPVVTPPTLPHLAMTPPEIILGESSPSTFTNVWLAGALSVYIASGKPITKTGNNEEKHLQNLYKVLGTPKTVGYSTFNALPFANVYGGQITLDDGVSKTESRCRLYKVLRSNIPSYILNSLSPPKNSRDSLQKKNDLTDMNGDNGFLLDLIFNSIYLVPWKRHIPRDLLASAIFTSVTPATMKDRQTSTRRLIDYFREEAEIKSAASVTSAREMDPLQVKHTVEFALQTYMLTDPRFSSSRPSSMLSLGESKFREGNSKCIQPPLPPPPPPPGAPPLPTSRA